MTIAPIKSERDYERTLHRIEVLMDAKPGTKAGDELDVLTTLVEAYEAKHYAVTRPIPSSQTAYPLGKSDRHGCMIDLRITPFIKASEHARCSCIGK